MEEGKDPKEENPATKQSTPSPEHSGEPRRPSGSTGGLGSPAEPPAGRVGFASSPPRVVSSPPRPFTSPPRAFTSPPFRTSPPFGSPPLAQSGVGGLGSEVSLEPRSAGFRPDSVKGTDHLNVRDEALRLAMVLAHKDVEPPIAVGLFGDWGSGKSFFMSEMRSLISRISEQSQKEDGPFCGHVVQLEFNAWHYMDSDLWASLALEIFEGLATAMADRENTAQDLDLERERLRAATRSTKDLIAATEVQVAEVQRQLDETQQKMTNAEQQRASVTDVAQSVVLSVLRTPEVEQKVRSAASDLQLDQVGRSVVDLQQELKQLTGLARAARALSVALGRQWQGLVLGLLLVALVALVAYQISSSYGSDIAGAATRLVSIIGAVVALLSTVGKSAKAIIDRVGTFQQSIDENVNRQREERTREIKTRQQKLDDDLKRLGDEKARQENELKRLQDLSLKLGKLDAGRQLVDFIRQRDASSDYRSQLGTVARASQDFKRLSDLMARAAAARRRQAAGKPEPGDEEDAKRPRIDRIVLYIDDLDRCQKNKVVDVLEAVHLLLAYPLFVVVVGVDPRWLLHSLEAHSAAFRLSTEPVENHANADWRSTSLDYLEKIFQIPYTLRPMGSKGFTRLVNDLSGWKEWTPALARSTASDFSSPAGGPSPPVAASPAGGVPEPERLELNSSILELDPREQQFMPRLHELIPTPRAAKRFVNVYRLIRASIDKGSDLHWFLDGGEFAAAQILLAMVSGAPAESSEILERLLALSKRDAMTTQWWELVDQVVKPQLHRPQWKRFNARLESLRRDYQVPSACDSYRKWADDVARYSFYSGRVLLGAEARLDEAGS
jgi:KAP family P-loop domain